MIVSLGPCTSTNQSQTYGMTMQKRQLSDVFKKIDRNGPIPTSRSDLGPCWQWLGTYNERRRMPEWSCNGQKYIPYRVTWELINGKPWPAGLIVLHECDNRRCCNPAHYRPGTVAQNNAEKEDRERDNGMSHRDVRIIRFLLGLSVARRAIAELMEVSVSTVHAVASGQNHSRTKSHEGSDSEGQATDHRATREGKEGGDSGGLE